MVGGDAALTILHINDFSYDKSLSKGRKVVWMPARHSIYALIQQTEGYRD